MDAFADPMGNNALGQRFYNILDDCVVMDRFQTLLSMSTCAPTSGRVVQDALHHHRRASDGDPGEAAFH